MKTDQLFLKLQIEKLERAIDTHLDNNDGSITWVEEYRELITLLDELVAEQ